MQLALSHKKTSVYSLEKANPRSPSGVEPTVPLAPNKKPLTSYEDRPKQSNQRTSRKNQENPCHDHLNKRKTKSKRSGDHLKAFRTHSPGGARLGMIEVLVRLKGPTVLTKPSNRRRR